MRVRSVAAVLAVGAGFALAACGEDPAPEVSSTTLTVTAPSTTSSSTTTTSESTITEPLSSPTTTTSDPDSSGGVSPDDSGEDAFDEFCDENPEACE